ncbi:EamA domain-containing protein [Balamuthia mandrillaris]
MAEQKRYPRYEYTPPAWGSLNDDAPRRQQERRTNRGWWRRALSAANKNKYLLLWVVASIVTGVAQGVYLKQVGTAMPDFPYFIFWFTAIFFVIAFYAFLFVVWLMGGIPRSMWFVVLYKSMIIGTLTTLNGIFMLFSNSHVPGIMQALLGPVRISRSLFLTSLCTGYYTDGDGVLFLVAQVQICMEANVGWNFCFLFGSLPLTIATVYQEKVFEDVPVHMAWGSLYQLTEKKWQGKKGQQKSPCASLLLLAGKISVDKDHRQTQPLRVGQLLTIFMTYAVDCIPDFGTSTFNNFVEHQTAALKCLFQGEVEHSLCPECQCDTAWLPMLLFTIAYILTNFAQLGVVKYGNATFLFIVSTLTLPLTEFAFALKFIMGAGETESISPYNYGALAVLLVGVILYRVFDRSALQKEVAEKESIVVMEEDGDEEKNEKKKVMISKERAYVSLTAVPGYGLAHGKVYVKQPKRRAMQPRQGASKAWTIVMNDGQDGNASSSTSRGGDGASSSATCVASPCDTTLSKYPSLRERPPTSPPFPHKVKGRVFISLHVKREKEFTFSQMWH